MLLQEFKTGWQNAFEHKLQTLFKLFPEITFKYAKRNSGMLQVKIESLDNDVQYVIDCVTFKIERESAKICEHCGKHGYRRFKGECELLNETICLCLKCYAIEVDNILSKQK